VPKICTGEKTASSTNGAGKTGFPRLKLDPSLSPSTSINSKWVKDLRVRSEIVKLIEEKIGNTLDHTGISNNFINEAPMAQQLRESIDRWDYMKLKRFCMAKQPVTRLKR
jgi:hypothetical protein